MKAEICGKCQSANGSGSYFNAIRNFSIAFLFASTLTACGGMRIAKAPTDSVLSKSTSWAADGTITLARAVPAPQSLSQEMMLGFLPGTLPALATPAERVGTWLSINKSEGSVTLFDGSAELGSFRGEGFEKLPNGIFHIVLKQRNPLWYAPDSYFSSRSLTAPPPGDKARFRRGALGDFVIFLDKNTPMHSGPMWINDIGGARMEENDLSRIYYRLEVGAPVEVK